MATSEEIVGLISPYASDARLQTALGLAAEQYRSSEVGSRWSELVAYHACHILAMSDRAKNAGTSGAAAVGPVTTKTSGPQTISHGGLGLSGLAASQASLTQTPYGLELLRIFGASFAYPEMVKPSLS